MATVKLAYVDAYKDRHGKQRFYYRRFGRRIALPGLPGEADFMAAYAQAAAEFSRAYPPSAAPKAGSFDALAVEYYQSPEFLLLRESTRRTYRGIAERFRDEHGDKRVAQLERRHIQKFITEAMRARGPHAANNLLKVLRVMLALAVSLDWVRDDPTIGVRPVRAKTKGFDTWGEDDIKAFEKRWEKGTRERLALTLLLYTGQRRGDVIGMGWQHVSGDTIRVTQSKTGARLAIPIHAELKSVLEQTPLDNMAFLMTAQGGPFTAAGFGNWFREACDSAGLKHLSAHGLRKAAATRLANAGCSALQIGAITGHKTLKEVSRYTAAADQEKLARDAMGRIQ